MSTDEAPEFLRTRDAAALGLTRSVLRTRRWSATSHGLRVRADAEDLVTRCRALAQELPQGAAFSHATALRLHGIELPWQIEDDERLHVVARARDQRPQRAEVVAHHSTQDALHVTSVGGLRVTSPAQTWVHVGVGLPVTDAVVLADAMMRRKRSLTTVDALADLATRTRKVKGVVGLRSAVPLLRARTDSSMETRTRLRLVDAGLPCPQVNCRVYDERGKFIAMPDMVYLAERIAIEYDGDVHRTDQHTWRRDVRRDRALQGIGWATVHVVSDDVRLDPGPFVGQVEHLLRLRRPPS